MCLRFCIFNVLGFGGVVAWFWCVAEFNKIDNGWQAGSTGMLVGCFVISGIAVAINWVKSVKGIYVEGFEKASEEELTELRGIAQIAIPEWEYEILKLEGRGCISRLPFSLLKIRGMRKRIEFFKWILEQCDARLGNKSFGNSDQKPDIEMGMPVVVPAVANA
jgi:hypothetical protein